MPSRWYLLFRNNCFIGEAAKLLEQYSVPYHTAAGFCIPKDALMKIKRYYNYRKTGFGSGDVFARFCAEHHIRDINEDFTESALIPTEKRYVYYDYVKKYGVAELEEIARKEPYILLSTTHRVKGGEADYVAVFLDCTHKVSANQMLNVNDELRVLYVACTRAKTGLYLVQREGAYGLDKVIEVAKEQAA